MMYQPACIQYMLPCVTHRQQHARNPLLPCWEAGYTHEHSINLLYHHERIWQSPWADPALGR